MYRFDGRFFFLAADSAFKVFTLPGRAISRPTSTSASLLALWALLGKPSSLRQIASLQKQITQLIEVMLVGAVVTRRCQMPPCSTHCGPSMPNVPLIDFLSWSDAYPDRVAVFVLGRAWVPMMVAPPKFLGSSWTPASAATLIGS